MQRGHVFDVHRQLINMGVRSDQCGILLVFVLRGAWPAADTFVVALLISAAQKVDLYPGMQR